MAEEVEWGVEIENIVRKYALQNSLEYKGKGVSGSVLGRIMSERKDLRSKAKLLKTYVEIEVNSANNLAKEHGIKSTNIDDIFKDNDIEIIKEGKIDGTDINIRVNDVISGPDGSFYCGTDATSWKNDVVFRINPDRSIDVVDEGVELCNGMAFSPDETTIYNTDSLKKIIYKGPYNKKNKIENILIDSNSYSIVRDLRIKGSLIHNFNTPKLLDENFKLNK